MYSYRNNKIHSSKTADVQYICLGVDVTALYASASITVAVMES